MSATTRPAAGEEVLKLRRMYTESVARLKAVAGEIESERASHAKLGAAALDQDAGEDARASAIRARDAAADTMGALEEERDTLEAVLGYIRSAQHRAKLAGAARRKTAKAHELAAKVREQAGLYRNLDLQLRELCDTVAQIAEISRSSAAETVDLRRDPRRKDGHNRLRVPIGPDEPGRLAGLYRDILSVFVTVGLASEAEGGWTVRWPGEGRAEECELAVSMLAGLADDYWPEAKELRVLADS